MKYYPIFLNLAGRHVLIVGAGEAALQKLTGLLDSQSHIHVVAPEALPEIEELARAHKVEWVRRPYRSSDLDSMQLVIVATDDPALQKRVAVEARARQLWVNVVDVTPLCDFIAPAVVSRGDVQIAVSTGGASPALAKFIREKLEPQFGSEYAALAELLRRYRPDILKLPKERRQAVWEAIINQEYINRIKRDGPESAEAQLKEFMNGKSVI